MRTVPYSEKKPCRAAIFGREERLLARWGRDPGSISVTPVGAGAALGRREQQEGCCWRYLMFWLQHQYCPGAGKCLMTKASSELITKVFRFEKSGLSKERGCCQANSNVTCCLALRIVLGGVL